MEENLIPGKDTMDTEEVVSSANVVEEPKEVEEVAPTDEVTTPSVSDEVPAEGNAVTTPSNETPSEE